MTCIYTLLTSLRGVGRFEVVNFTIIFIVTIIVYLRAVTLL